MRIFKTSHRPAKAKRHSDPEQMTESMIRKYTKSSSDIPRIQKLAFTALAERAEFCTEEAIPCAVCGTANECYVHIIASGVHQNGTLRLIAGDGEHVVKGLPSLGRGSAVITIYQGECVHCWAEIRRFHKGQVFRGEVRLPDLGEFDTWPATLWRD